MDKRNVQLAKNLLNYSVKLQKGENLLIDMRGDSSELVRAIVAEAYKIGANPFIEIRDNLVHREYLMGVTEEQLKIRFEVEKSLMENMDAYIGIINEADVFENSDVPHENLQLWPKMLRPVQNVRLTKKWVGLRFPNPAMSQSAKMSQDAFKEFYYNVCGLDYEKMGEAMKPLMALLDKTDKVYITGRGTDLHFSIKDIPSVACNGLRNIPDGEVYTAPVKDSVEGYITYTIPSMLDGFSYENVKLEFEKGKIVKATCNDNEKIAAVLNRDEGAKYIGEFAIGVNPYITKPIGDILFDEKMVGSFHFTPGNAYEGADNGNKSALHWDLVCAQAPEYGGGEIYFDGVLVRKDGRFVLPELDCLNPENLM